MALNSSDRWFYRYVRSAMIGAVLACASTLRGAPPTIVSTDPLPVDWIVGADGLDTITIEFDRDVVIPNGAISVRTVGGASVSALDITPLALPTSSVTVTFAPVSNNRVTLVVDYTITNGDGEPLDGEVDLPVDPLFPTGDGAPGGQAVFQFSVLQGDVNRDGIVDSVDLSQLNAAANNYKPNADLNRDGVVNQADQTILLANAGATIPKTDKSAPFVVAITPPSVPLLTGSLIVTFNEAISPASLSPRSLHVIGENGQLLSGSAAPIRINDARYEFPFAQITCAQNYEVKVSRAIADISGELLAPVPKHTLFGSDSTPPALRCPDPTFVNSTDPFSVSLEAITTSAAIQSFLDGASASDDCTASGGITLFTSLDAPAASLPLGANTVVFSAVDEAGNMSSCEGSLIVVPAVPLEGPPGADGIDGIPGEDGVTGLPGIACWDLDGDGFGDVNEDTNGDEVVNILDCQGSDGTPGDQGVPGPPGRDGSSGSDGTDGTDGEPPAGSPSGSTTRLCGAIGMISPLLMFFGLAGLRTTRRFGTSS